MKQKSDNDIQQKVLEAIKQQLPAHVDLELSFPVANYIIDAALQYRDIKVAIMVVPDSNNPQEKLQREDTLCAEEWIYLEITHQEWKSLTAKDQSLFISEQIFGIMPMASPQKVQEQQPTTSLRKRQKNQTPQQRSIFGFFGQTHPNKKEQKKTVKSCRNCWGLFG